MQAPLFYGFEVYPRDFSHHVSIDQDHLSGSSNRPDVPSIWPGRARSPTSRRGSSSLGRPRSSSSLKSHPERQEFPEIPADRV